MKDGEMSSDVTEMLTRARAALKILNGEERVFPREARLVYDLNTGLWSAFVDMHKLLTATSPSDVVVALCDEIAKMVHERIACSSEQLNIAGKALVALGAVR